MADSRLDCTKLTVPQLKARCKELKLTGYSKLGKAALLEKLAQYTSTSSLDPSPVLAVEGNSAPIATRTDKPPLAVTQFQDLAGTVVPTILPNISKDLVSDDKENEATLSVPSPSEFIVSSITSTADSATVLYQTSSDQLNKKEGGVKRRHEDPAEKSTPAAQKRQKLMDKPLAGSRPTGSPVRGRPTKLSSFTPLTLKVSSATLENQGDKHDPTQGALLGSSDTLKSIINFSTSSALAKRSSSGRFRPLIPRPKSEMKLTDPNRDQGNIVFNDKLVYLEFYSAPPTTSHSVLQSISIPPSLSQRKRINAWSVILSGLSDAERRTCAQVSRVFRYAVYLSAVPIITRAFGRRRFDLLHRPYNMSMTNFWPMLRQLQSELDDNKRACAASFVAKFFRNRVPIGNDIWGCPENDKQLTIALRFLMTRLWFTISINGRDQEKMKSSVVTNVHELVVDEIWAITVAVPSVSVVGSTLETFYVLEPTCEVIGLPPAAERTISISGAFNAAARVSAKALRVDWSYYVEHRKANDALSGSLLSHLKWTNEEEYTRGISKLWLSRIFKEGKIGEYKKRVAERYVIACVVANSVSGRWMSSSHMLQVFAGTASESDVGPMSLLRPVQRVNLFLPAHHLVESVHFTSSGPKIQPLHPALASVQTPAREYFILRDNGMEVGCEEDGVWPVWMELLECDARGISCT